MLRLLTLLLLAWSTAAAAIDAYPLGPQDQIEVNIANYAELKTATRVGADGTVTLPLIGNIAVGGLGAGEAAEAIAARYQAGGYIKTPSVRVEITDYQSRKASVLGQVTSQGLIVLDRTYSVAEIIAKAGGLGAEAADSAVIVRQRQGGGSDRFTIDLGKFDDAGGTSALTRVEAGDVIIVPRAPTFSVVGAVNKAGTYRLTPGMTVQQALAAAGDVARIGTRSGIKIRRLVEPGKTTLIEVLPDNEVQANDVILVRERLF